jgi:hypothetical protein
MDWTNNYVAIELLTPQKREKLHPNNSTIVLKNEDGISLFLIQTSNKGGGGKPQQPSIVMSWVSYSSSLMLMSMGSRRASMWQTVWD